MKGRIIIDYDDFVRIPEALDHVRKVVEGGRVSEARGRKQFCFVTVFDDGCKVYARELKRDGAADSFKVWRTNDN